MTEERPPDFAGVYEAYHDRVVACARRLLGREDADDVAQEVFLKIDRSLPSLADPAKLSSWVYSITLNTVRDAARARASRHAPAAGSAGEEAPLRLLTGGSERTPEEIAIRNEMIACYLDFVDELPPDYHEVYVLAEFENLSGEDIARRLSLPVSAVKMRLHRARSRLNEALRCHCRPYYNERGELMGEPKAR